jgi:hypothetical protein
MGVKLGDVVVYLRGDDSQLNKDLDSAQGKTEGWASKLGGSVKSTIGGALALGGAAIGAGIVGLVAGLVDVVGEAGASQEVLAQTQAVIESTGGVAGVTEGQVSDLASMYQRLTKFSDETIQSGENMLLTFTNIGKEVFPDATKTALDMATALKTDPVQAAMMLGKALNDPIQGVTALRRVGVQLTDEQETMVKSLMESGDIMGAQKVILGELTREFGGSAEAAGKTFPGQIEIAKNMLSDFKEGIGMQVIPILEKFGTIALDAANNVLPQLSGFISTYLIPIFSDFMDTVGAALPGVIDWLGKFATQVQTAFNSPDVQNFIAALVGIGKAVVDLAVQAGPTIDKIIQFVSENVKLSDVLTGIGAAIAYVVIPALLTVAGPILATIAAVAAVIAAVALLRTAWETDFMGIRTALTDFWNNQAKPALEELWTWLQINVPIAIQTLADFWNNTLLPALSDFWNFIQTKVIPAFQAVWEFINTKVIPVLAAIGNVIGAVVNLALTAMAGLFEKVLLPALTKAWDFINKYVLPVLRDMADVVKTVLGPPLQWLKDNVIDPLARSFGGVKTSVKDVVDWLNNLARKINELKLPDWLTPGSPTPFEMGLRGISDAMKDVSGLAMPQFGAGLGGLPTMAGAGAGAGGSSATIGSINFYGQSAPKNEREAKESADLVRDELKKRGLL